MSQCQVMLTNTTAALQSLLLIPRSPSPVPLEERDVDTLSAEEMRELLRRQRVRLTTLEPLSDLTLSRNAMLQPALSSKKPASSESVPTTEAAPLQTMLVKEKLLSCQPKEDARASLRLSMRMEWKRSTLLERAWTLRTWRSPRSPGNHDSNTSGARIGWSLRI